METLAGGQWDFYWLVVFTAGQGGYRCWELMFGCFDCVPGGIIIVVVSFTGRGDPGWWPGGFCWLVVLTAGQDDCHHWWLAFGCFDCVPGELSSLLSWLRDVEILAGGQEGVIGALFRLRAMWTVIVRSWSFVVLTASRGTVIVVVSVAERGEFSWWPGEIFVGSLF